MSYKYNLYCAAALPAVPEDNVKNLTFAVPILEP